MKKPIKFKSAEAKRLFMEQQESWEKLKKTHGADRPTMTTKGAKPVKRNHNPRVAELRALPSLDTGVTGAVTTGVEPKVYTGDKMIGIATMHKSNLVPIFNDDAAKDVSKMRR